VISFIRLFTPPPLGDIQILFPGQRELSVSLGSVGLAVQGLSCCF
jgi:hypothetical protein